MQYLIALILWYVSLKLESLQSCSRSRFGASWRALSYPRSSLSTGEHSRQKSSVENQEKCTILDSFVLFYNVQILPVAMSCYWSVTERDLLHTPPMFYGMLYPISYRLVSSVKSFQKTHFILNELCFGKLQNLSFSQAHTCIETLRYGL